MDNLEISAQDTFKIIEDSNTLIIDVREDYEYSGNLGHIKNSKLIPMGEISNNLNIFKENSDKKIILVCRSGSRSLHAARYLNKLGLNNILSLNGGMIKWNQLSYPIEK
jgi:sulfur dioxygenase